MMKTIIESLSHWEPFDPQERMAQLKNRDAPRPRGSLVLGDRLSPLDLYVYLKARFGPPNGIQMALRSPSSDNIFHWHYTIRAAEGTIIEVLQSNLTTELSVEGIDSPTESEWDQLIRAIKGDFKKYGSNMSNVRRHLEYWHLFVNPYKRLLDVLDRCCNDLKSLDIDCTNVPKTPGTPEELRVFIETLSGERVRFEEALKLAVTIRMLAPVLGEAFVNLLIFLLAKNDIKADQRLYQDVIRRAIDVRVKSLHINCNGFARPVPTDSTPFKAFQTLMNNRNDFLHGNVDPTKLKYDVVHFDYQTIPIFEKRASFGELALSHRLVHVEPERALKDRETVAHFVEIVMDSLEPDIPRLG